MLEMEHDDHNIAECVSEIFTEEFRRNCKFSRKNSDIDRITTTEDYVESIDE